MARHLNIYKFSNSGNNFSKHNFKTVICLNVHIFLYNHYIDYSANLESGWKNITKRQMIPADLQKQQLLIKTKSPVGSRDEIYLFFYDGSGSLAGGVLVYFSSPFKYWLSFCNNSFYNFPVVPPIAVEDVWAISRTKNGIKIECNGQIILEKDVSPSNCSHSNSDFWSREVRKVQFSDSDSASLLYRLDPPGLNCLKVILI